MKFAFFDKVISAAKDYHLPALMFMFSAGGVMSWFHRLDTNFVAFAGVIVGGLGAHAWSPAGRPDPPSTENGQGQ